MSRTFKVSLINKKDTTHSGRYHASSHSAAAKKAFSQFCRREGRKRRCGASITMVETTKGSKKKTKAYNLAREVLKPKVKTIRKDGSEQTYKYKTIVKSAF